MSETTTETKQDERAELLARLREEFKPGETAYTVVRHVARSGMSRKISLHTIKDGHPFLWSMLAAKAIGMPCDRDLGAVKVSGCGMDMGFHLVYELSSCLFPDGFGCIGRGCPSNDHSNGDRDYTPHGAGRVCQHCDLTEGEPYRGPCMTCPRCVKPTVERSSAHTHWHKDGGYALRQRWL